MRSALVFSRSSFCNWFGQVDLVGDPVSIAGLLAVFGTAAWTKDAIGLVAALTTAAKGKHLELPAGLFGLGHGVALVLGVSYSKARTTFQSFFLA
jgi:hypothetical protein